MQALSQASAGLAQKMYEEQAQEAGPDMGGADASGASDAGPDDAVDAEFEEVKDEDKK